MSRDSRAGQDNLEDFKDQTIKHPLSKFEYDLYHEEEDVSLPVIRVKRVNMPNHGRKWKIMFDNKVSFIIESTKISKKERDYLETVDGFNFILEQAKIGIKSFNHFRTQLKKILKPETILTSKPTHKIRKKSK